MALLSVLYVVCLPIAAAVLEMAPVRAALQAIADAKAKQYDCNIAIAAQTASETKIAIFIIVGLASMLVLDLDWQNPFVLVLEARPGSWVGAKGAAASDAWQAFREICATRS